MHTKTKMLTRAALMAAVTGVAAYLTIPIQPVPFTMQPFAVMLSGVILGGRYGFISMVIYLLLGGIGVPVFAGGKSGFGIIFGPTGGYLLSYPIAAFLIGYLTERRSSQTYLWNTLALLAGLAVIYILGVWQLRSVLKLDLAKAISIGCIPYIGFDLIKVALAAYLGLKIKPLLR